MSLIKKMSILGIRSFGPKNDDRQVIQFQHPLTLIVGPNGAGKTTIIECLKYATTGDHPQNTKGGAFVHDPKLVLETEVKAKVQLLCTNVHGETITVERGMVAIQKQKTIQCKTLDGVITKIKKNGEEVQIPSKCANINREMVASLGVSTAVLENVIFCHQEDSNWPLSEGKSVKQKFDDIFEATRYIKALEELRKVQKDKKSEITRLKGEMPHLEIYCKTAKEKTEQLQTVQTKYDTAEQSARDLMVDLQPLDGDIRRLRQQQDQVRELQLKRQTIDSRLKQMLTDKNKLKSRIRNLFKGTDEELNTLREEEDMGLTNIKEEVDQLNRNIRKIDDEVAELTKKKLDYSTKQGQLQSEIEACELKRQKRDDLIRNHGDKIEFIVSEEEVLTTQQVADFLQSFGKHCEEEENKLASVKSQLETELRQVEDEQQEVQQSETELRVRTKHVKDTLIQKKEKQAKNLRELSRLKSASENDELENLQTKLENAQEKLAEAQKCGGNVEEIRLEIKRLLRKNMQDQQTRDSIEKDLGVLHKTSETRMKISMMEKEIESKEEVIADNKKICFDGLSDFGFSTKLPTVTTLDNLLQEKEESSKNIRNKLDDKRMELGRLREKRDMIHTQTKEKQSRMNDLDESLFEICGSQDLVSEITMMESQIEDLQESKGLLHGTQHLFRDYIKKLKSKDDHNDSDAPCPLCHRAFEDISEVLELTQDLEKKLEMAPKKLESRMKELKQKEERYKMLLEQKPVKSELDVLSGKTLPTLTSQAESIESKISNIEEEMEGLEAQLESSRKDKNVVKSLHPKLLVVYSSEKEVRDLKRKTKVLGDTMPTLTSRKTIDELNQEKKDLSAAVNKNSQIIDQKRREIEDKNEKLNQLREEVNAAKEEKVNLTGQLQKIEQLREEQENLSVEVNKLKGEFAENEEKRAPLQRRVEDIKKRRASLDRNKERKLSQMKLELQYGRKIFDEINEMAKEIEVYDENNYDLLAEKLRKKLSSAESKISYKNEQQQEMRKAIGDLQNKSASFADRQRDLEDNQLLREREREVVEVNEQISQIMSQLGGENSDKIERELNALRKKYQSIEKEKERCAVRQEGFRETMSLLKRELNQNNYKNADSVYRDCLVRSTVLTMAADDLEKYYKALDRAIMQFHKTKMDEINKIIRELWQQTYRGRDIDYIEICSSDDTGSLSATRRTFNYRVVMHAGNVAMDMRGRCSAGQKVLASIVIRLALAETFCINCGVLALDEPTTNLDRDNIEGLAEALVDIIESRQRQRNFQLIVITHDEEFVELLGRSSYVDHFFRVNKDDSGKSHIMRCPIRSLGAEEQFT